jgi:hypothetical protein
MNASNSLDATPVTKGAAVMPATSNSKAKALA